MEGVSEQKDAGGTAGSRRRTGMVVACGLVITAAAWAAWRMRWTCDDAFITYRYAENWLEGLGPVFNAGERVEGYSHFLWLVLLTLGGAAGVSPVDASLVLGVLSYVVLLAVVAWAGFRLHRGGFMPLALLATSLNYDYRVWVTGGLETQMFAMLVTAAWAVAFASELRERARLVTVGVLLAALAMTRPEGLLFAVLANVFLVIALWLQGHLSVRRMMAPAILLNTPVVLLVGTWFAWKLSYYGDVLPNTYYAKEAGDWQFAQGFYYIWLYLRVYFSSFLVVLSVPVFLIRRKRSRSEVIGDWRVAAMAGALVAVVAYLVLFVAKVGGDFMFARFVVPTVPLVYIAMEFAIAILFERKAAAGIFACVIVLAMAPVEKLMRRQLFPYHLVVNPGPGDAIKHRGITDEHWYYTTPMNHGLSLIDTGMSVGLELRESVEDTEAAFLITYQNVIAYYGRFPVAIERNGLTDHAIAHSPAPEGGRVGHIKDATRGYLEERGTDFSLFNPPAGARPYQEARLRLFSGNVPMWLVTYDRKFLDQMETRLRMDYMRFEDYLDNYIEKQLNVQPLDHVARDYEEFRGYYFNHTPDVEREKPFLAKLGKSGIEPRAAAGIRRAKIHESAE